MQVFINDREIGSVSPAGLLVGEVIEALGVHVEPDEVILEVDLDGESFSAAEETFTRRSAANIGTLALRTVASRELGLGMRADVVDALVVVSAKVGRSIELFLDGELAKAHALLGDLMEELRLVLLLDSQTAALAGAEMITSPKELEGVAGGLLRAEERNDTSEVRYLLESELGPLLALWRQRIASAS